ncbi:MAG: PD-(D/E)XK nuclease family protein [Acidobacteriia bacterium]|nr:PD-(D/E)XK nuclease family protein [Terriglobia bacterium]
MKATRVEPIELANSLKKILPIASPLPAATIIVPSSRMASSLRRELTGEGALSGVRFFTPIELAEDILLKGGVAFQRCSQAARALGLQVLIESRELEGRLEYLDLGQLRTGPGYSQAISITLAELESAGLGPDDLLKLSVKNGGIPERRFHDLATLWAAVEERFLSDVPPAWTVARILREAARCLQEFPGSFSYSGPRVLVLCGDVTNVEARFYASIPDLQLLYVPALPERSETNRRLDYVSDLLGVRLDSETILTDGRSELDVLRAFLFQPPQTLANPARARSQEADGTVHLEVTSGIEEELAVAVRWVAEQVFEHHTPLERIAVLLPSLDPLAGMLVERLSRLDWMNYAVTMGNVEGQAPVYVAGGLPTRMMPMGTKIGTLLRTLGVRLAAEELVSLFPALGTQRSEGGEERINRADACEVVYRCGTLGGSRAHPEGYREWRPALERRVAILQRVIEKGEGVVDPEIPTYPRGIEPLRRQLQMVQLILPAVRALEELCHHVQSNESLETLWQSVEKFCDEWFLHFPDFYVFLSSLKESIQTLIRSWLVQDLRGDDALRAIQSELDGLRVPTARFGQPCLYIGTIQSAVGLTFDAVRFIGLSEGQLPSAPHEDSILPDLDRDQIEAGLFGGQRALPRGADRAMSDLHALHRTIRGVRKEVVLSAPRETLDRQTREPSGVLLEAAAALWRHSLKDGPTPTMSVFRSAYLQPGRQSRPDAMKLAGVGPSVSQQAVAEIHNSPVHGSWVAEQKRMRELILIADTNQFSIFDGILGEGSLMPFDLGIDPMHPLSATRLLKLIECPHRFLLECVLGWEEPDEPRTGMEIDALAYGSLLHRALEKFLKENGADFSARKGDLKKWLGSAKKIALDEFKEFLDEYPLIGAALREWNQKHLQLDIARVLRWDWEHWPTPSRFIAAEQGFGYPLPVPLDLNPKVYFRGFIDRIDEQPNGLFIRDLKSGRSHPRVGDERQPIPRLDTQLAVYARALESGASFAGKKMAGVAYVYAKTGGDLERRFEKDLSDLLSESQNWLMLCAQLLQHRLFPRTTNSEDCTYCPFRPVCGETANQRAAEKLSSATGTLESFREFKERYQEK